MKPRTKPEQVSTRSLSAIEELCVAVARRLSGLGGVRRIEVLEIVGDPEGRNWRVGKVEISPPLSPDDQKRIEDALEPWRHRFKLAAGDQE
jgi:hypothetical protein